MPLLSLVGLSLSLSFPFLLLMLLSSVSYMEVVPAYSPSMGLAGREHLMTTQTGTFLGWLYCMTRAENN